MFNFWTEEKRQEALARSEMAAEVTLPADQFRELLAFTPNKPAEVDLDALKDLAMRFILDRLTSGEADHPEAVKQFIDYLASSGHLATGKGGGEPAAPTQIDAGELGSAVESLKAVLCDPEGKCCIPGSDADIKIIDDALSTLTHLSKLSGGE